jgi:hypothetical protein
MYCLLLAALAQGDVGEADKRWWKLPAEREIRQCVGVHLSGYQTNVARKAEGAGTDYGTLTLRVLVKGDEVFRHDVHSQTTLARIGNVLYLADYDPHASGCSVIAYDLGAQKHLWKTELKGLGPINHSKYWNRVLLSAENGVLVVRGLEHAGRYLEEVDPKTGKTRSNVVLPAVRRRGGGPPDLDAPRPPMP